MAGASTKKRSHADSAAAGKPQRPQKKQKKVPRYQSDSEEDLDNALVDDIASLSGSDIDSESDADAPALTPAARSRGKSSKKSLGEGESDSQDGASAAAESDDNDDDTAGEEDEFTSSEGEASNIGSKRPKSKRNDPDAFATSLQKILSTVSRHLDIHLDNSLLIHCPHRNFPVLKGPTLFCPAAPRRKRPAERLSTQH